MTVIFYTFLYWILNLVYSDSIFELKVSKEVLKP